jgi:Holliday junction resolvase-like predicted endonuclease
LNLAREMIAHKASEKVSTVYEIDIITKDGRRVRLEVSTRLILRDGKPIGVQGIARDLTERKHSEEVLRESQAFLAQQAQREAMTHRISQAIRCSLDSHEIYRTAVKELGTYLAVDRCSLFMRDDRAKCALNVAEYHVRGVEPAASDFPLDHLQSLIKALDNTGVLPFSDAANDERISDLYANILSKANVKSIMYVAICRRRSRFQPRDRSDTGVKLILDSLKPSQTRRGSRFDKPSSTRKLNRRRYVKPS